MKNILKVIGVLLVLRVVFRLLRGRRGRFAGGPWRRRMAGYRAAFEAMPGAPVPIDEPWGRPTRGPRNGAARSVTVD
ncbi:hypothetical protein [Hymenobacter daeguensis]